jgi:YgiT-type zinc finger domain-containing protein
LVADNWIYVDEGNFMKCFKCGKGQLERKQVSRTVEVDGAGAISVDGISVFECNNCHIRSIDDSALDDETREVMAVLLERFTPIALPAKVGNWMRQALGLSGAELVHIIGTGDPSTLFQAVKNDRTLDPFMAMTLILLSRDFIDQSTDGAALIERLKAKTIVVASKPQTSVLVSAVKKSKRDLKEFIKKLKRTSVVKEYHGLKRRSA